MIRIAILTATRAEYGLLRPLIRRMKEDAEIEVSLLVTGTHLSKEYGMTCNEIEQDGNTINVKIPILSYGQDGIDVSNTMANALNKFSEFFKKTRIDFLVVDGDRYETLAVCIAAVNSSIPIVHIGGGEITEGAADEYYRHAISKLSYLHFTVMDVCRKRVIQMGEDPKRVFVSGALGIENIMNINYISKKELEKELNFSLDKPYAVVTYHPVTLENNSEIIQTKEILSACEYFQNYKFIFTKSNADHGGNKINDSIQEYVNNNRKQAVCVASLGAVKYLSALKYASFVMGNSSSGIIEAPSFNIPTINIGDRQRGRVQADSILNCRPERNEIIKCIKETESEKCRAVCENVKNPYGDGKASRKIIDEIKYYIKNNVIDLKKSFYDIEFEQRG